MVFNARTKRTVYATMNEDESITLVQASPDAEGEIVEHRVTIGIGDLADILSEFGLAEIEYTEDNES